MKTKIKRHSRVVLSVALAVCMVVSCLAVGLIATNAAYVDGIIPSKNAADVTGGGTNGTKSSKDGGEALGAAADDESLGFTSGDGVHLGIGTTNLTWHSMGDDTYTFTVNSSTTIYYCFSAGGYNYKKHSSSSTPSGSNTSSGNDYYCKKEGVDGANTDFSISVSAGTYNFKLKSTSGDDLRYGFWKTNTSYTISYNSPSNGSFTTKPTSANSGASVSVVATPSEGYQINTVSVYKTGDSSTTVSATRNGNTITFTMPSYNVTVNVTFSICSYTITTSATHCTIAGAGSTATYNSTVNFTVTPDEDYALKSLTVKQGSTTITTTSTGSNAYTFTMPAGNVTITATCASTAGTAIFRFKSATAWVYQPYISINGGAETKMTLTDPVDYLDHYTNPKAVHPYSQTGSLRYAWYQATLTGIDTSKPVTITVRGQDTYMEATGTFTVGSGSELILACDNLMEGSTLVNLSSETDAVKDFYESPLHMVATAAEKAAINGS